MLNERPITLPRVSILEKAKQAVSPSGGNTDTRNNTGSKSERENKSIVDTPKGGGASKQVTGTTFTSALSTKPKPVSGKKDDSRQSVLGQAVVFGRDGKGKAHASRFEGHLKATISVAAHLMGFQAMVVNHPTVDAIAKNLPEGRVFESGKGFVPFVKDGVCATLEAHAKQFPDDLLKLTKAEMADVEKENKQRAEELGVKAKAGSKPSASNASAKHGSADKAKGRGGSTSKQADAGKTDHSIDGFTSPMLTTNEGATAPAEDGVDSGGDKDIAGKDAGKQNAVGKATADQVIGGEANGNQADTDKTDEDTPTKPSPAFDGWSDINKGERVLAVDDPDDGWWEAEVLKVKKTGLRENTIHLLTLQWVEAPEDGEFERRSNEVAYFHPAYGQTSPADDKGAKQGNPYAKAKGKS